MSQHIARPLGREHMPTDYKFSLAAYTGRGSGKEQRIPDDFGPQQTLRGFEDTYRNIIDYIVRITYRIWEDRDVEYILDCYSDDSQVYDDYGLQLGNQKIVDDTHHTTGAFSNIELVADEIIWAGDDQIGFHTSHRTLIRGTNDGDSNYGPATDKDVDVLVIANCVALENDIFLEHVCYNSSSMLRQLGLDLDQMAAKLLASPPAGWPRETHVWDGLRSATRPERPISVSSPIDGFDVDKFVRSNAEALWNQGNYDVLATVYRDTFAFRGPTDRSFSGIAGYRELVVSLRIAFPDIELQVDEVYWMGNEAEGFLVSVRWSATGTHRGDGPYGPPTDKTIQIWGITQQQIVAGRIVREWMLFNELDLMMQLAAARR